MWVDPARCGQRQNREAERFAAVAVDNGAGPFRFTVASAAVAS